MIGSQTQHDIQAKDRGLLMPRLKSIWHTSQR